MISVTLREVEKSDSDRIFSWRNQPEVARYMYSDHVIAPEEHAAWFSKALSDPKRRYWIIELDKHPVGLANLYDIDLIHARCAWAYYLADPSVRGKGVGSYVEYYVLNHVFEAMTLNKLWCEVLAGNEAVWSLHEKFGFRREALFRDHVRKDGAFQDVVGLGMVANDWRAKKPALRQRLIEKGFTPPE